MIFAHGPMRGSEKIGLQLPSGVRRFVLNPIPQQGRHLPWTLPWSSMYWLCALCLLSLAQFCSGHS